MNHPVSSWSRLSYKLSLILLTLTGMGQLPIFKRYYIADLPGLGWLAQFYTTHILHYLGAIILLALIAYLAVLYQGRWRKYYQLSISGLVRICLLLLIIGSGALRVAKNMPSIHFSPDLTMLLDWGHLFLAVFFLLAALIFRLFRKSPYLLQKSLT